MPDDMNHPLGTDGAFTLTHRGGVRYLTCQAFEASGFILHAFCTRWGGVSEGNLADFNFGTQGDDKEEHLARNRALLRGAFDLRDDHPVTVSQVHGHRILMVDETMMQEAHPVASLEYDGIITATRGIAVGIKTADCVPVLLADRKRKVVGAVHAGWRGTARGIAARAIGLLVRFHASNPHDIIAAIGPAIGPCCYEVNETVTRAFDNVSAPNHAFSPGSEEGKWMCDLVAANRFQLQRAGVPLHNIFSTDLCTSCRPDLFFSHRRERGNTGRQISFIMARDMPV